MSSIRYGQSSRLRFLRLSRVRLLLPLLLKLYVGRQDPYEQIHHHVHRPVGLVVTDHPVFLHSPSGSVGRDFCVHQLLGQPQV